MSLLRCCSNTYTPPLIVVAVLQETRVLLQQAAQQEAIQQHQQPAGGLIAGIAELTGLHWGQQRPSVFSTGVAPDWWPLSQASLCWDRIQTLQKLKAAEIISGELIDVGSC